MPDIIFDPTQEELLIHPWSRKGAQWVWKYLTTNVTTLHYSDQKRGQEVLAAMRQDGLKVVSNDEYEKNTAETEAEDQWGVFDTPQDVCLHCHSEDITNEDGPDDLNRLPVTCQNCGYQWHEPNVL